MIEQDEKDLSDILLKAAEKLGQNRKVSPELWRDMLKGQFLGLTSSISELQMSGPVTPEQVKREMAINQQRERGLRDALEGKKQRRSDCDYLIGYEAGIDYCKRDGELSKPENIGKY